MNRWVRSLDAVDTGVRAVRRRWYATPLPRRRDWQAVAGSAVVGLTVAVTAVATTGPWDSGQRTAERGWAADREPDSGQGHTDDGRPDDGTAPRPGAPPVLGALGSESSPPSGKGLGKAFKKLLKDPALGNRTTLSVGDALTGEELYASGGGDAVVPASTIKIATGAAVLTALGPEHRIPTRTVWDAKKKRVVLVGGGDPTVTEKQFASLATATARSLKKRGLKPTALGYDTSRYSGPDRHPIGINDNIAPLTPLMVNSGRTDDSSKGPAPRALDPSADAAERFAGLLRDRGVDTDRTVAAKAAKGWTQSIDGREKDLPGSGGNDGGGGDDGRPGTELGVHRSAPMSSLVERMLVNSDNDIAEALARQTALATGRTADFGGAEQAVRSQLKKLDLPMKGTRFADGSGLSRADRVSASFLTELLARAAEPDRAALRPLLTGLPVAGFNGTLGGRYGTPDTQRGAGLVRAKTGTLTGVNSLAGTVVDADGRLLTFALVTTGAKDSRAAQNALDALAGRLADCGCR
ncbi:D-alanyl-D-alanine carboxypeptidase/D-alanyl-D-alanine-endopeptidase [Streptomyces sp. P38-E01]|uniref:D-alanyl-D-alanine carboxypeptidase/D-alanyl-D-alanine-endopeptidase n=1 Tax=Streptomyces tardus TaxID=2780544 RepID=A0A949JGF1_9ACTN|nr:D-alanyl-D-alanine carboxypeptidase/D-alanyl-D-alanine-endopeptidase [Streptomyces tardus]MBU7598125.1 D-alanyl-D-alanine carboxypeptidase/D-alanyl-D-alanine-endopeptidase [Streptomyces tardus]